MPAEGALIPEPVGRFAVPEADHGRITYLAISPGGYWSTTIAPPPPPPSSPTAAIPAPWPPAALTRALSPRKTDESKEERPSPSRHAVVVVTTVPPSEQLFVLTNYGHCGLAYHVGRSTMLLWRFAASRSWPPAAASVEAEGEAVDLPDVPDAYRQYYSLPPAAPAVGGDQALGGTTRGSRRPSTTPAVGPGAGERRRSVGGRRSSDAMKKAARRESE